MVKAKCMVELVQSPSIAVGAQPNLGGLDPLGGHWDKVDHVFKDKFTYILSPGYTDIFPVGILSAWTCSVVFLLMIVAETNRFATKHSALQIEVHHSQDKRDLHYSLGTVSTLG